MTTVVDSNVLVALWDPVDVLNSAAQSALDSALDRGRLVVPAPVFAELMAFPTRTEVFLDSFFRETGIEVDWRIEERVWRLAGRAFQRYVARRRANGSSPRRILADFLIGAYAAQTGHRLLTLDDRLYRAAFPELVIVTA